MAEASLQQQGRCIHKGIAVSIIVLQKDRLYISANFVPVIFRRSTITGLDQWTGLVDWTTGLTFGAGNRKPRP